MVEPSRILLGLTAALLLISVSGCLGIAGETDTTTDPQTETPSNNIPEEKFKSDKIHGTISGESLDGYDVKVSVVAENKSAYRCSVTKFNKRISNATKVDAISFTKTTCDGVLVKAVSFM